MTATAQKILNIIKDSPNIKAKDIGKKLGLTRKEVNHYIYSELKTVCEQNSKYEWSIKNRTEGRPIKTNNSTNHKKVSTQAETHNIKKKIAKKETTDNHKNNEIGNDNSNKIENTKSTIYSKPATNNDISTDPLKKLCSYYIECLMLEQDTGKELYAESKFELQYRDILNWPITNSSYSTETNEFIQKILSDKNLYGYIGYPVLVTLVGGYKKLTPIFLWEIDKETGNVDFSTVPIINANIVKHYVSRNSEAVVKELVQLEKDLNIYDSESIYSINDLVNNLVLCRNWEWNDEYDNTHINPHSFSEITNQGIYNKAIIFSESQSPYTKGLLVELNKIAQLSLEECEGTALYDWLTNTISTDHYGTKRQLLEVLPLNTEQKAAIEKSISGNLTVVTGPPGTGKSQVVIDLIINQIYNNHSILFSSKNNKAVEVVISRANELCKKPFVCKLGGKAGNMELTDTLSQLLNAETSLQTKKELATKQRVLQNYREELDSISHEIDNFCAERNALDAQEFEIEELRREYEGFFSGEISLDVDDLRIKWDDFKNARYHIFKENNSFLVRLFWKNHIEELNKKAIASLQSIHEYLDMIGEDIPDDIDDIKQLNILVVEDKIHELCDNVYDINKYKNSLELFLKQHDDRFSLEKLEKDYDDIYDKYVDASQSYWNTWLSVNHTALTAKDKQTIIEYMNGIKLVSDIEDDTVPDEVKQIYKKVQHVIPKYINAQAVTLLSAKGKLPFDPGCYDLLVVDEASQCDIASAIPLLYRAKRAVIIGDINQLTHISNLPKARDQELLRKYDITDLSWLYSVSSLFALAQSRASSENVIKLREHHRSHADIIEFSNSEFYGGDLVIATNYDRLTLPPKTNPGVKWIDVKGNAVRPRSGSLYNEAEAHEIVQQLSDLSNKGYVGSIGVIAPYRKQAECIVKELQTNEELYEQLSNRNDLEVNTVHQFQGDERDVIFFSCTISKDVDDHSLFFLRENRNLFNVAITRARALLIAVGDKEFSKECNVPYLERFCKYVENKETESNHLEDEYSIISTPTYPKVSNIDQVSDWEIMFYEALYKAGIKTKPQYPADKYLLDLALFTKTKRLDIEVDGEMYHKDWDGELCYRDRLRNQRLYELGWDVKRFWVYQIRDKLDECVDEVKKWMENNQ